MAQIYRVSFNEEATAVGPDREGGNNRKPSSETIHSGHFMVSEVHEQKPGAYDFSKAIKDTFKNYNFVRQKNTEIDASLSKLFECLTIAFSGNVVSPKWKTFKGMKLNISDKIRLNNAIWRAWHIQFKQNKKPVVCQFATPHTDHIHATTQCVDELAQAAWLTTKAEQAVVLEGKYWKRTLDTVVQEYKRWRIFFKEKNSKDPQDNEMLELKNRAELVEQTKEAEGNLLYTPTTQPNPSPMIIDSDHDLLSEFTDTLFSSLSNQPFSFPNPREIAHAGNADMIQPGLVQLQPNLDEDFMDTTFEPLQDFLEKVQNSVNQIPGTFVFMGNNTNFLSDMSTSQQQQPSQLQLTGNDSNLAFEDNALSQPVNMPLEEAINQLTGTEQQQQQQQLQQQAPQAQSQLQAAGTTLQQFITTPMSIPSSFLTGNITSDQATPGLLASSPPTNLSSLSSSLQFQPLTAQLSQPATIQVNQVKSGSAFTVVTQIPSLLSQTPPLLQQQKTTTNQLLQSGLNLNQQTQQPQQQFTVGGFGLGQQQPQMQQAQDLTGQSQAISLLQQAIELASGRQSQNFAQIQPQTFARPEKKPLVSELLAQSRTQRAAGFTLAPVASQQTQVTQSSLTQPSPISQQITQISQTLPQTVQVTNTPHQPTLTTQPVLQAQLQAATLQQPVITQGLLQPQQPAQQQQQQQQATQQQAFPTAVVATTVAPATVVLPTVPQQQQQQAVSSNSRNRRGSGGSTQSQSSGGKTKASPVRPKQPMKIAPAPSPAILTTVANAGITVSTASASNNAFLAQLLTTGTYPGQVGVHAISTPTTVATAPPGTTSTTVLLQPIKTELNSNTGGSCAMNTSNLQSTLSSTQPGLIISGSQLGDLSSTLLLSSPAANTATSPVGRVSEVTVKSSSVVTNANTITTATPQASSTVKGSLMSDSPSPTTSTLFSNDAANSSTSTVNAVELEENFTSNTIDDEEDDEIKTSDTRRTSHISAEQKRRVNIKAGFDMLQNLIPALNQNPNQKVSKASMLQKAVEFTTKLKNERGKMQDEAAGLRTEIQKLNAAINNTQAQLPATGVPVTKQRFDQMSAMFDEYVQTRTGQNWKFWIFSIIIRPLFESYNGMVSTASMDELCRTVLAWLDQHCSLTRLRPAVLSSLRQLSTTTSILSDPSLVPEQAAQAVRRPQNPGSSGSTQ